MLSDERVCEDNCIISCLEIILKARSLCEMLVVVVAPCSGGEYSASHNLVLCHENNSLHLMKLPPNDLTIG